MNQQKEAARQILGHVSDIQAVVSLCGLNEVNLKLADIREKAAFLLEGARGPEKVIAGYEGEAHESMMMLKGMLEERGGGPIKMSAADMVEIMRMAEICVRRVRVCLDRRARYAHIEIQNQRKTHVN